MLTRSETRKGIKRILIDNDEYSTFEWLHSDRETSQKFMNLEKALLTRSFRQSDDTLVNLYAFPDHKSESIWYKLNDYATRLYTVVDMEKLFDENTKYNEMMDNCIHGPVILQKMDRNGKELPMDDDTMRLLHSEWFTFDKSDRHFTF
jgi:hypothetical protein